MCPSDVLAARVLEQEHIILPKAIRIFIEQQSYVRIGVGDEWVWVPPGYITNESEYTKKESDEFYEASRHHPEGHPEVERLRQIALDKRVEYYQLYLSALTSE